MARYDRIARLDPPERDGAFTGWLALRDLEGRERETELGRRGRLRFLAVRLVHRLIERGDEIDGDSLQQQSNGLREELGQLPSRDMERERFADLAERVPDGDAAAIVRATFGLGDAARAQGHRFAAEECYLVGIALARRNGLAELRSGGLRRLADVGDRPGDAPGS